MKHAVLILAHNNPSYVNRLIDSFDEDFYVFIHWDKKTWNKTDLPMLLAHTNVKGVYSRYKVYWGGYSIIKSTLLLCRKAIKYQDIEYIHLISGSDVLTQDLSRFKNTFSMHSSNNFMEYFKLPTKFWEGGGLNRLLYYHITDKVDIRTRKGSEKYCENLNKQTCTKSKRKLPNFPIYGGSNWWSLRKECVSYVIKESKKNYWKELFTDTYVPDEMYFQTILMNSQYASKITSNNFRYVFWNKRNGSFPAILDQTDIIPLLLSDCLFARKIDSNLPVSETLVLALQEIIHNTPFSIKGVCKKKQLKIIAKGLFELVDTWESEGLMCGKMGICLFLYHYGCATELQKYWNKAYKILCGIIQNSKANTELDYNHGLLGIASAIEYLRNNQFIELNTDELLENIDSLVTDFLQQMLDNGFNKSQMLYYHFDIYVQQRKKNKPEFNKLPAFEDELKQLETQFQNNQNLLSQWFKEPENIKCPGIIGWAGYGWNLISEIYPEYPIDNSLFYEYMAPKARS